MMQRCISGSRPGLPPRGASRYLPVREATLQGPEIAARLAVPAGDDLRLLPGDCVAPRIAPMMLGDDGAAVAMRCRGRVTPPGKGDDAEWQIRVAAAFSAIAPRHLRPTHAIFLGAGRIIRHDASGMSTEQRIFRLA